MHDRLQSLRSLFHISTSVYAKAAGLQPPVRLSVAQATGTGARRGDDGRGVRRGREVEELLRGLAQGSAFLRHKDERTLHEIGAVFDGCFRRGHTVDGQGLDAVLEGSQGGIADAFGFWDTGM